MSGRIVSTLLAALVVVSLASHHVAAHEIRPALLEITERSPGEYDVLWKVPTRGDMVISVTPVMPRALVQVGPPAIRIVPGARIERYSFTSDGSSLVGSEIKFDGLTAFQIDVIVRIVLADGASHSAIVQPKLPSYVVPQQSSKIDVAWSYSKMGFTHIIEGVDHLLFVFAMLLLVAGFGRLLKTITAFTVAHSVTLALATLGAVNLPAAPTEAMIALSIVFVAVEIVRKHRGETSYTEQHPWVVAFLFGLFHGLGFAGALSEIGVPSHEVPLALLMFNVGVEAGQVAFVCVVLGAFFVASKITWPEIRRASLREAATLAPAFAIGGIAAFWTIQRVVSFLPALV